MTSDQSSALFREASQYFQNNQFNEALQRLNQLNKAFPGNQKILYPLAQCMANTNRPDDARKICNFLIQQFDDPNAKQLLEKIDAPEDPLAALGLGNFDLGLDPVPSHAANANQPPLQRATAFEESIPYLIWVAIALVAYIQYILVSKGFDVQAFTLDINDAIENQTLSISDFSPIFGLGISSLIYNYIFAIFISYFALKTFSALPNDDFMDDMKDAALYTFFCFLLFFIPVFGWIAIPVIISKHYELEFGKTILVVIVWIVYDLILTAINWTIS